MRNKYEMNFYILHIKFIYKLFIELHNENWSDHFLKQYNMFVKAQQTNVAKQFIHQIFYHFSNTWAWSKVGSISTVKSLLLALLLGAPYLTSELLCTSHFCNESAPRLNQFISFPPLRKIIILSAVGWSTKNKLYWCYCYYMLRVSASSVCKTFILQLLNDS